LETASFEGNPGGSGKETLFRTDPFSCGVDNELGSEELLLIEKGRKPTKDLFLPR
jgi:hypothetical protein